MGKGLIVGIVVAACLIGVVLFLGLTFLATNESKLTNKSVDYSQPENWLSLPSSPDKAVDVFYLYPTSYRPNTSDPCICDIDNPSMLSGAKSAYARQVTAFAPVANIYSPYYRQASTRCRMNLLTTEQEQIVGSTPTSDALAAFDYYIQHCNNGRPFILAGHSQGSNVMANLLSQYMKDHPDVYKRMVAAYVIGYSITPQYLAQNPNLKFAEGPDDTGVIISYNTEGPFVNGTNPVTMPGGIAINPITWSRTEELAPASESLGSFLPGKNGTGGKVQNYADAQINKTKGVIICNSVNESAIAPIDALAGFPEGIYHSFDYPFYYYNLQANAVNRINHYFNRSFSTPTNYSLPAHWLSLPSSPGKAVDVFYLYPTAWQKTNASDPNICDVDNPSMIKGSNAAFAEQATAFEPIANIYAPYYRQVYTASLLLPLQEQETLLKNATIPDVTAAFDYYINYYNNGRPFILAGHSQGSNALIYILSDYMKAHPDVYKRMVAAYVIGYSITPTYLANNPHLKFAEGPNDTGVIVSYNTEAPVLNGTDPVVLPGALVINPITWTRTEDLATANQSLGSYLPNQNGTDVLVKNYADAQINMTKGALICSTANPNKLAPGNVAVGKGIYHTFDYLFYYYNIRANVADRINHYFNQLSSTSPSYPIDSVVVTTVNRTLIPVPVPATSPKIKPYDIANFSKYGYGVWQYGPGLPYEKRLDIMSSTYNATDVTNVADLLNFFTMTDIHITDKESPAEAIFYGYAWNVISGYSPAMLHTTHTLDAAVQTINALNKQKQFDFGFSLGDDVNSGQQNELKWFIDVLDGKKINPDSGIKDDPIPGPLNDYQDEYQAAGLNKSIPWYAVLGNHDHYWMGMYPPDDYVRNAFIGNTSLNMGNVLADPVVGINSRGYYMGVVNGSTPYGNIIAVGPVANFNTAPLIPAADPNRHFISRNEWIGQFLNSSSYPVGHGFNQTNAATGFACYTFEPKSNVPIKVIVLDDTQPDTDPSDETNGHGSLDAQRYNWLVNELDNGQAEGKLMVIAAHIPIGIDSPDNDLGSGAMAWSKYSYVNDTALLAKLHTYPNLILWVSGHRHLNAITAQKSPDPTRPELGFWEVETSSLREFPQQFRMFNIVRNSDNTISIFATDVDPAVKNGTLAATARSYAVAAKELFNVTMPPEPTGAYNAQLLKQLTPEMQNKIPNYGMPIGK